jgi:hypothetical protein
MNRKTSQNILNITDHKRRQDLSQQSSITKPLLRCHRRYIQRRQSPARICTATSRDHLRNICEPIEEFSRDPGNYRNAGDTTEPRYTLLGLVQQEKGRGSYESMTVIITSRFRIIARKICVNWNQRFTCVLGAGATASPLLFP